MTINNAIINVVLGIILLTTGKKLYWLFVAIIGFVAGLSLTTQYVTLNPPWLVYAVAAGIGLLGAILATFLQRLAIALVGFVVGGYGAVYVSGLFGMTTQPASMMAFILGGIVGLLLVASIFDWALYILSAWAGTTLVTQSIGLQSTVGLVTFFVLFVLGIIIQAGMFRDQPAKKPVEPAPEVTPTKKP